MVTASVAFAISETVLFAGLREWLKSWNPRLGKLACCDYCIGHWVALGLDGDLRMAYLLGLRLGFEHTFHPSAGGLTTGLFGEAGGGHISSFRAPSFGFAYGEVGGTLGYALSPSGGKSLHNIFEAAVVGAVGIGTGPDLRDPETLRWFRLGISIGWRF